jgi:hypothetical protein
MVVGLWTWAAFAGPADVPVTFQITTNTTVGQSVFVLGSIPQLYSWNPVYAIKLVPNSCTGTACTWSATVAILQGTSYQYKFVERNDCATCYSYATNIVYEMPYNINRVGATLAEPPPPWSGKTAFYLSSWSTVSLLYSNTTTGSFALQPNADQRSGRPDRSRLSAARVRPEHRETLSGALHARWAKPVPRNGGAERLQLGRGHQRERSDSIRENAGDDHRGCGQFQRSIL